MNKDKSAIEMWNIKAKTQNAMTHDCLHKFQKLNALIIIILHIDYINANAEIHSSIIDYWDVDSSKFYSIYSW